jgi:DNA-binding SARP family transcriptional activator
MWLGVLGPLLVVHEGTVIPVPSAKQRLVLAALLTQPNRVVSPESLIDAMWDADPPDSAQVTMRNHVRRLRQTLGPAVGARIVTRHPGYLMEIGEDECDLLAFVRLCRLGQAAARSGQWRTAVDVLDEALALWRGDPLADVPSPSLRRAEGPRIEELRLQALESRVEAKLSLGESDDLVADLRRLVARHPLRERLHAQLMLALYRAGRQGEALAAYQAAHLALIRELGVDPGVELQLLHARILRADPELLVPATISTPPPMPDNSSPTADLVRPELLEQPEQPASQPSVSNLTPRQLPAAPRHFVGRTTELKTLWESLPGFADAEDAPAGAPVTICAIEGTAGIGKTVLALHWAHQAADRFPDGQVYVNLRGFDPVGQPMAPAEAVRGFLDAFGVPVARIPTGVDAQAALYRSLVADKRVLVVLDNARDIDQIRPLLPGSSSCLVLITSRSQLAGLVAAEGAQSLALGVLTAAEGRDLLEARLLAERVAADPRAVAELIGLCAGLPLALGIVAARAAIHAQLPLATLASELRDARNLLDALDIGDPTTDVRAAVSWSYRSLGPAAARMLRLLAVHAGPDISLPAAASLSGAPITETRRALRELTRANLLAEQVPGRFSMHDLLRVYAAEQTRGHGGESAAELREAVHRLLDHYLHTGDAATTLIDPTRETTDAPPARPGVTLETIGDDARALQWFEAEHQALLAVAERAATAGFDLHAWQIPFMMTVFFDRRGHWHNWVAAQLLGLEAARRLGDLGAQTRIHRSLAAAHTALSSYDDARTHYLHSLDLCQRLDDQVGEAHVHRGLSMVCEMQGRDAEALSHSWRAFELYTAAGHKSGQAHALNDLGWSYGQAGDFEAAVRYCEQALELLRELGDVDGEAATWDSLGYAHRRLGQHTVAMSCYRRALTIYQQLGDRYRQARTLVRLGDGSSAVGDLPAAREDWWQALAILGELGHPNAEEVRAKLRGLTGQMPID